MFDLITTKKATEDILKYLKEVNYSDFTIKMNFRSPYNQLFRFMESNRLKEFNEAVACDYLFYSTGIRPEGLYGEFYCKKLNRIMRAVCVLEKYLRNHEIQLDWRKRKAPYIPPRQFEDFYYRYMDYCNSQNFASATLDTLFRFARIFLDFVSSQEIKTFDDLTPSVYAGFLSQYKNHSKKYVNTILFAVKKLLIFAYEQGDSSLDLSVQLPKVRILRNAFVPSTWEKENIKQLLLSIDRNNPSGKREYAILLLVAKLGLRVSDVRNLRLSDLNWEKRTLSLTMQKTGYPIELPLLDDIGWAVIDYLKNGRPESSSDRIFLKHRAPYTAFGERESFQEILRRSMVKAGIDIPAGKHWGLHSFRSTLAKSMLEAKTPLPVISEALGHQHTQSTAYYIKIDMEGLKKCMLDPEEVFIDGQ